MAGRISRRKKLDKLGEEGDEGAWVGAAGPTEDPATMDKVNLL